MTSKLSVKKGTLLWKNHAKNVHQKLFPDPLLILVNNPKQLLHARTKKKQDALKENFRKPLFFLLNTVPFDRDDNEKQKETGTTNHLFLWLKKKNKKNCFISVFNT